MRNLVRKLGHFQVIILITLAAVISAEILAYIIIRIFDFPYPLPSTPVVTFLVTAILTPFISWHLLELLFFIDKMEQKMNDLATYNAMTKVFSRQAFFEQAQKLHQDFQEEGKVYTVCIIDIDNFKSINDNYGHAAGDKVLTHFGEILNQTFIDNNIVGRIGGEEFAVFIDGDTRTCQSIVEKLQRNIALSTTVFKEHPITFTVSIGICENNMTQMSLDEALSQADKALYHAKRTGKNKMVVFSDELLNHHSDNIRNMTT